MADLTKKPTAPQSMLGQFKDEVVGELKNIPKDTAKKAAQEPKKIMETILGKAPVSNENSDQGIEQQNSRGQSSNGQLAGAKQQNLMVQKQIEEKQRSEQSLKLHRKRLEEEKQFHEMKKRQQEAQEETEDSHEEEEKNEIIQLQREKQKSVQLTRQIQGQLGSKEFGKGKKF